MGRPKRAGTIAAGVKPADPRGCLAQEGHTARLPRRQGISPRLFRTLHARSHTAKPSRPERYKPKQAPPSHGSVSSTGTTFAFPSSMLAATPRHRRPRRTNQEFQGWLGLEERREWGTNLLAGSIPQGCAEHIAAACAHLENVTRTATKAASVPRSRTADPR